MYCTVRRRLRARAAREGAIRIAGDIAMWCFGQGSPRGRMESAGVAVAFRYVKVTECQ